MHYVYITTNLINKKYYIGKHKGEVDDRYLGSGVVLKQAIEKYGKDNFEKEILVICSTEEEANHWERITIQEHLSDPNCYNIAPGGEGGYTIKHFSEEEKQKVRQKASKSYKQYIISHPEEVKSRQERQKVTLLSNIENHRKAVKEGLLTRSEEDKKAQHEKITQKKLDNGYYSEYQLIDPEGNTVMQSIGAENIAKKYGATPNGIRLAAKHRQPISRGVLKGYKVVKI
ncbi:MAG TPA: GIY-YIG nuclease family protein [Candidatus Absconditabacterales bacterium]|nr:GIY-YIG nuclease family protein [Candidatus Absconditabacterales bacterium]